MPRPSHHEDYMRHAVSLARRGLGRVAPNPSVGCVVVKNGHIVGRGFTQPGGRPHAETEALREAGEKAQGASLYVTLEPCAHFGQTPPCAEAIINAGVTAVYIGSNDPDPRVSGKGIRLLERSAIAVTSGILGSACDTINAGFFKKITNNRPQFTLKMATSADGYSALANGESQWITGTAARMNGHLLRANHDAILVGVGTVLADDPTLTCRIEGLEDRSPIRVVLDRQLRTPLRSTLVQTVKDVPTIILTESKASTPFKEAGVTVIRLDDLSNMTGIAACLADQGLTRVLVEGGATVHASFLKAGFADEVWHYSAPMWIGGDGLPACKDLGLGDLQNGKTHKLIENRQIGEDLLAVYRSKG